MRVLLDAGVPDSVGCVFAGAGHEVIYHREMLPDAARDELVCATAIAHGAILVALDGDMTRMARKYGAIRDGRYRDLNLIKFYCNETIASKRLDQALTLIAHEWSFTRRKASRRMWIDIAPHFIKTNR